MNIKNSYFTEEEDIVVRAMDEPEDGANHEFCVLEILEGDEEKVIGWATFQNGPAREVGRNGIRDEEFLLMIYERLKSFQRGPYACKENAVALIGIRQALAALGRRTHGRVAEGKEGTSEL